MTGWTAHVTHALPSGGFPPPTGLVYPGLTIAESDELRALLHEALVEKERRAAYEKSGVPARIMQLSRKGQRGLS